MPPIKIAIVTPGSFPIPSSNSSSVERIVEKVAPLLQPSAEPRIYGRLSRSQPKRGKLQGVVCERYPAVDKKKYIKQVTHAVKAFAPNVIDIENRPAYVLTMRRKYPGKQIWLNLHSSTFIGSRHISHAKLRRCLQAANKIIVNSQFLRRVVISKCPESASKIEVIYPGVDTSRFPSRYSAAGAEKRSRLRKQRDLFGKKVVLFIGRLIPLKGVHHLLHIVPQLAKKHPELMVVIVGSPFYGSHRKTSYSRSLERLGNKYPGHVQFVPYVPYEKVPGWMLCADVVVVPSGSREAFGLVNVEAMSCGTPVIATRAGGMKEIVRDGITGYFVSQRHVKAELFNRLDLLLSNRALAESLGRNSRDRVERSFTWRNTANQWLNLMNK